MTLYGIHKANFHFIHFLKFIILFALTTNEPFSLN